MTRLAASQRYRHFCEGAAARAIPQDDASVLQFEQPLDDGESQAGSTLTRRKKRLEHAITDVVPNSGAAIRDRDSADVSLGGRVQVNRLARRRLTGIHRQVEQSRPQHVRVGVGRQRLPGDLDRRDGPACGHPRTLGDVTQKGDNVDGL